MKKLTLLLAVVATLAGNGAYAQTTGKAASAGKTTANNDLAWGLGLAGIAVIGTVVGVVASAASHDPSTFSH